MSKLWQVEIMTLDHNYDSHHFEKKVKIMTSWNYDTRPQLWQSSFWEKGQNYVKLKLWHTKPSQNYEIKS